MLGHFGLKFPMLFYLTLHFPFIGRSQLALTQLFLKIRLGKILFWTLEELDVYPVLKLDDKEGREGLVLYYEWEFSKRCQVIRCLILSRDLKAKIVDHFRRQRFSRLKLWGIELGLSLQLWVKAVTCGQQKWRTEQRKTALLHSFNSVWTARPVITPQVTMHSSAMVWHETDAKKGSRANFLPFTGRKSLCMGSMGSLAHSGFKPCSVLTVGLSMTWGSLAAPVPDTAPVSEEGKGRSCKGEREQLELIGTKDNKMDEEGVSEERD